jgi:2'-5' RNA ligase
MRAEAVYIFRQWLYSYVFQFQHNYYKHEMNCRIMADNQLEYTLWLLPSSRVSKKFEKIIRSLGTKYQTQFFTPHVTLLGDISLPRNEVMEKTHSISTKIRQIEIEIGQIGFSDKFYKRLFYCVAPNLELNSAHLLACKSMGLNPTGEYYPHLSLLYGNCKIDEKSENTFCSHLIGARFKVVSIALLSHIHGSTRWERVVEYKLLK